MLNTLILIMAVTVAAVLASMLFKLRNLPHWLEDLLLSGLVFVALGWIAGPSGTGIVGAAELSALEIFADLAVGWVGFLLGLQLDKSTLRRLHRRYVLAVFVEGSTTLAVVCAGFAVASAVPNCDSPSRWTNLFLGALAISVSPTLAAACLQRWPDRAERARPLLAMASLSGMASVTLAAMLFCHRDGEPSATVQALALTIAFGIVVGILLHLMSLPRLNDVELLVVLSGTVLFAVGAARMIGAPALMACMVAGLVVALRSPRLNRIRSAMSGQEKPVFLLLLFAAGLMWRPELRLLVTAACFVVFRAAGKFLGGRVASVFLAEEEKTPWLGAGLLPQGGVALAVAIGSHALLEQEVASLALNAVLVSMIAGWAVGRRSLRIAVPEAPA